MTAAINGRWPAIGGSSTTAAGEELRDVQRLTASASACPSPSSWAWNADGTRGASAPARHPDGRRLRHPRPRVPAVGWRGAHRILRAGGRRRSSSTRPRDSAKSTPWRRNGGRSSRRRPAPDRLADNRQRHDNNEVWFLSHLLRSIRRVRPRWPVVGARAREHGDDAGRVLTSLIDEIHENDDRIAVVIDDWHRVRQPHPSCPGFPRWTTVSPPAAHRDQLVSRRYGLRIGDELAEIDSARFALRYRRGRRAAERCWWSAITARNVQARPASTDGWAAALRLRRAVAARRGDATQLLRGLSGASDVIREFLSACWTLETNCANSYLWHRSPNARARRAGLGAGRDHQWAGDAGEATAAVCNGPNDGSGFASTKCSPTFSTVASNLAGLSGWRNCTWGIGLVRRERLPARK